MKKKSILGRVGIVAAALTLATTSMMSGTLARYAMSKSVGAEAIIAKWDPKITDGAGNQIKATIELATTIIPGGGANQDHIGTSAGQDRIAPGTKGSTTIKVDVSGAEVPTLCTIEAKQKENYIFPGHIKVTIKDGTTVIGTMAPTWDTENGYQDPLEAAGGTVTLVGTAEHPAVEFQSVRDKNPTQVKVYTLEWEWPLDKTDMATAGEADEKAFNETDYTEGRQASATAKFGFDLVVNLRQKGDGD